MEKAVRLWDAFPIYGYEKGTLISREKGCLTIPLKLTLPEIFTLTPQDYISLQELFFQILQILGPHSLVHRQDYFLEKKYMASSHRLQGDLMERCNERYFEHRPCLYGKHYLYLSKVPKNYLNYDPFRVGSSLRKTRDSNIKQSCPEEFLDSDLHNELETQVGQVIKIIQESGLIEARRLSYDELFGEGGLYETYYGLGESNPILSDLSFTKIGLQTHSKEAQFYTLENLNQFTKDYITPFEHYGKFSSEQHPFPVGNLFSLGFKIPQEHILNQYIYVPDQDTLLRKWKKKMKRFQHFSTGKASDRNTIYAKQIEDFTSDLLNHHKQAVYYHLNVLGITNLKNKGETVYDIPSGFKKLRIYPKQNMIDRKNLFFGGVPGHAIGISSDLYLPMASDMASSLLYFEGGYHEETQTENGLRMINRVTGSPISVSVFRKPEENHWIFNRGMLVTSGSGGGKSYWTNHYIASELRMGTEAIIMEDGNSYDKLTQLYKGIILEHSDEHPFTFNPFLLDKYDFQVSDLGAKRLSENKLLHLVTLLQLITKGTKESISLDLKTDVLEKLITGYYVHQWKSSNPNYRFDTFYDYTKEHLINILKTHGISETAFDPHVFLFLLQKYHSRGERGRLLNQMDKRIQDLSNQKLVYFKLGGLIDNPLLFPITALMVMDLFTKKMQDPNKLSTNKIMAVDEAWKALDRPELSHYFNGLSRMARKRGGQPIFISQKVDDFIASDIIRDAIVVNSHIKVFLDMRDFQNSFSKIQQVMGLVEKQKQLILSLNKDLRPHSSYREVAICWMDRIKVYGVETSLEERCLYETNPEECDYINAIHKENEKCWPLTASAYAYSKTKLDNNEN